jgi:hypothetical protein
MPSKPALLETARARLIAAHAALDSALSAGESTAKPRERADLAAAEVARLEKELDADLAAGEVARHASLEAEAERLATDAHGCILAEVADLAAISSPWVGPIPASPVLSLVQARAKVAQQEAALSAHGGRLAALKDRLADLRTQRQGIVERRAAGDTKPSDGADLALLVADTEGLLGLIERTEQDVPIVDGKPVADWLKIHETTVAAVRNAALAEVANRLSLALAETLGRLPHQGRIWRMPSELSQALRGVC